MGLAILAGMAGAEPINTVITGSYNDYESWVDRLHDGRMMIIFDRNPDWASGDLYVTFSDDNGWSWSAPQAIISDPGDQATLSFVQMQDDTIKLFYASNQTGTYKIYSAWSMDGINWTKTGIVDLGWSSSTMYYDPTVVLEIDGSLTMSYVVSGSGVYIAHCPYGGNWDTDKTQISNSGYRPRIIKNHDQYLYAYHRRTGTSSQYDVFVKSSLDRVNWSAEIQLTTNQNSHDPFPAAMYDGSYMVYYAKYTGTAYNIFKRKSTDGVTWEPEEQITFGNKNSTQPHVHVEYLQTYLVWAYAEDYNNDDHDVYIMPFVYSTCCDCGDANNDGSVNIDDANWITGYLYRGYPAPYGSIDVDLCGSVNIADYIYFVDAVFGEGPDPCSDEGLCVLPSDGNFISLGCTVQAAGHTGDSVAIPVYLTSDTDLKAVSCSFEINSDDITVSSIDFTGSILPESNRIANIDGNRIYVVWHYIISPPEILAPKDEGLLFNIWVQIPVGTPASEVDITKNIFSDSGPLWDFILAVDGGGVIYPDFVDCGISDLVVYYPDYICGDANSDTMVNVSDAVYIINYVFSGGNAPDPLESADVNCDSKQNVSDAVYIINFVFSGGKYPCDTDGDSIPEC